MTNLAFGAWLKRRRRALDLTQQDLASRAFCSVHTIRKIEAGDLVPSKTLALEIARALALTDAVHEQFLSFARTAKSTAPEDAFLLAPAHPPAHTPREAATDRPGKATPP